MVNTALRLLQKQEIRFTDLDETWTAISHPTFSSDSSTPRRAGIRVGLLLTRHFSLLTGLEATQINVIRRDSQNAILYPQYLNNLDLPILAGYRTTVGKVTFTVNGGIFINLRSNATGIPGSAWPGRSGTTTYLGVNFTWALNDRTALFAVPYGRCLYTTYPYIFAAQIYSTGALLGVRYHFDLRNPFNDLRNLFRH